MTRLQTSYSFLYRKDEGGSSSPPSQESPSSPSRENIQAGIFDVRQTNDKKDKKDGTGEPYFLNYDCSIYDKNYKLYSQLSFFQKNDLDVIQAIPLPQKFETYQEYEQALLNWHHKVEYILHQYNLQLPRVMGLHHSRPLTKEELQEYDQKHIGRPRVLEKDPWESQLIPDEPDPELYTTYEEYRTALSRWAILCSKLPAGMVPPHASQIAEADLLQCANSVLKSSLPPGTKLYLRKHGKPK